MEDNLQDDRFKQITSDPRFRSVAKQQRKVKVDDRFRSMFSDKKFKVKYSVDKRGKPQNYTTNENLKKYYELTSSSENDENSEDDIDKSLSKQSGPSHQPDFSRGEGNVETSSSSEDESSDEDSELVHPWGELRNTLTTEEATSRLAVCSMDWDRISAKDIFFLCKSFTPPGGLIKSVKIYLSDFGRQRLELEEVKGPAELTETTIFEDQVDANPDDDPVEEKYHMEKLRQYQLNRLNYYYAVVECDNAVTASRIYEECDGLEYESSATKMDLRYIPNDMEFNEEPLSSADGTLDGSDYRPKYFTTTALQSSKVQLTWDETNPNRTEVIHRAFDKKEEEDMEVKAYLASSTDEEDTDRKIDFQTDSDTDSNKEDGIAKYKAILRAMETNEDTKKDKDVHLEITWGPGLKEKTEEIIQKKLKEKKIMTPWEQYMDKRKEKKKLKQDQKQLDENEDQQDTDNPYSDDEIPSDVDLNDQYFKQELNSGEKQGKQKGKQRHKHLAASSEKPNDEQQNVGNCLTLSQLVDSFPIERSIPLRRFMPAELSLLLMNDDNDKKHFSLHKLIEKNGKVKKNKKKLKAEESVVEDDFEMDLNDPRFGALYTSHLYNIDPSQPHFKKTKGIQKVMEEKQKRRLGKELDDINNKKTKLNSQDSGNQILDVAGINMNSKKKEKVKLSSLVKSVKSKAKTFNQSTKITTNKQQI